MVLILFLLIICYFLVYEKKNTPQLVFDKLLKEYGVTITSFPYKKIGEESFENYSVTEKGLEKVIEKTPRTLLGRAWAPKAHGEVVSEDKTGFEISGIIKKFEAPAGYWWDKERKILRPTGICENVTKKGTVRGITYINWQDLELREEKYHERLFAVCNLEEGMEIKNCADLGTDLFFDTSKHDKITNTPCKKEDFCHDKINGFTYQTDEQPKHEYYRCNNGKSVLTRCPGDKFFIPGQGCVDYKVTTICQGELDGRTKPRDDVSFWTCWKHEGKITYCPYGVYYYSGKHYCSACKEGINILLVYKTIFITQPTSVLKCVNNQSSEAKCASKKTINYNIPLPDNSATYKPLYPRYKFFDEDIIIRENFVDVETMSCVLSNERNLKSVWSEIAVTASYAVGLPKFTLNLKTRLLYGEKYKFFNYFGVVYNPQGEKIALITDSLAFVMATEIHPLPFSRLTKFISNTDDYMKLKFVWDARQELGDVHYSRTSFYPFVTETEGSLISVRIGFFFLVSWVFVDVNREYISENTLDDFTSKYFKQFLPGDFLNHKPVQRFECWSRVNNDGVIPSNDSCFQEWLCLISKVNVFNLNDPDLVKCFKLIKVVNDQPGLESQVAYNIYNSSVKNIPMTSVFDDQIINENLRDVLSYKTLGNYNSD